MSYKKLKEDTSFVRDMSSNGIVNVNNQAYHEFIKKKNEKRQEMLKLQQFQTDINILKTELSEIKSMFNQIITKLDSTK